MKMSKWAKIFLFSCIFVDLLLCSGKKIFGEEVDFDIYCFDNAPYVVIGEVLEKEHSITAKDFEYLKHRSVDIEIKEVLKGGVLPKIISIMFDEGDLTRQPNIKEGLRKGKKILLFLNPTIAYYYTPILYGSIYFLDENNIGVYKEQLKSISDILYGDLPESMLRKYGFFDHKNCQIIYEVVGGYSRYTMLKFTIFGGGFVKCEINRAGKKDSEIVEFRLSEGFVKEFISAFARFDFFDINYVCKRLGKVKDASLEKLTYAYGNMKHTIQGMPETYTNDLTEYYFGNLSHRFIKLLYYAEENLNTASEKIPEYTGIPTFASVKEKLEQDARFKGFEEAIRCDEKDKLIPYLISKLDFKKNTFWVQGATRVNLIRILRYLTHCDFGYDDKFLYNSSDEEIQKVKSAWENWWQKRK